MFNLEDFDFKLNTEYIGRNFVFVEEIDSTNSFLLDKNNKFNENGTVLLAESQTQGRGRKQRMWQSTAGANLTFSILLNKKGYIPESLGLLNMAVSLAVANSIENLHTVKTNLKWPNDVLINGKKLVGILSESVSQGSNIERVVIGIGINVNQNYFPEDFNLPPTSIKLETNQTVEREKLLSEVLINIENVISRLLEYPADVLTDWRAKCNMIGDKVSITDGNSTKVGIFDDIDDEGYLLLRERSGRIEKIHFGDVSLR